ncbi:SSI family serine proteinase inhibitor [Nocardiopsis sp. NRRL B-16309]|uniref:SSI family serine proteinase inhibitor n=1 Tax=Nocardiopsis sp. NRRL B-16309 TaxID=1519494 RepID=UPI0006B05DB3|nr:SSI family serine proteinase inhibitor [Nocardiopsis sp. NRRL B-16309]KOX13220.1 proteinase inhibitor I4 serpin [Nocardiopsis sp. NRRL B-16309]
MAQLTIATALPARLAALAALGLLITACGTEPDEVGTAAPEAEQESASPPDEDDQEASPDPDDDTQDPDTPDDTEATPPAADTVLTIERTLSDDEALTPEAGYEEGVWTLTCDPVGGDHPEAEAACDEIAEVGTEPFLMDTSDMMCTMQMGGPEVVHVTGHIGDTEIDTEFNKVGGCEIDRFETVETVIAF